ncbi:OB-fold domain and Zn-ribbon containing protein,possible acyl-CoA-binding protein [Halanaeroarchaeum sp. HSR-CO]|uniref:Zn-ribbon domain-containing OB-fold protein n=1 Tax=Halanaeroarchaeum sp. HSR-CO TaxID=2866382 RepID=UPI00217CFE14|nr:OB-fold domain-containing protein [Halanaeroarchaeum sp. HSR-CO]UWG47619.1 OB-fold domain and Zn-ribbon containing protein,possible acyl-CoA-binding protein [Halanaeroarchaeum sp. HSR-CO]
MTERVRDAGYDDFVDSLEDGAGYYLQCAEGHGSLPPRRVCPHCGDRDLTERALPETGEVVAHTVVHVPTPRFIDDAPYITAVVDFGEVQLTGQVVDVEPDSMTDGISVSPSVSRTETNDDRLIVFESR